MFRIIIYTFASHLTKGTLADRLGNGLQNRVGQFDSARYLHKVGKFFIELSHFILILIYPIGIEVNIPTKWEVFIIIVP